MWGHIEINQRSGSGATQTRDSIGRYTRVDSTELIREPILP